MDREKAKAIMRRLGPATLDRMAKDIGAETFDPIDEESCAMPHTGKRKKYDQSRTPWTRLGPREAEILDAGWRHIQSVPYKVSTRWLFYRLLQDGYYKGKNDYKNNFTKLFSRARHTGQGSWAPDSLEDEGRSIIWRADGCENEAEAVDRMRVNVLEAAYVPLNHFYRQENYVEIWYEANAMTSQFEHYTRDVDLVPMAGSASISHKWKIAKRLEDAALTYDKPIVILYFGDEDAAGHVIQKTIEKDVGRWSDEPFKIVWAGLTLDQAEQYGIPENFEKKGYQWEALPDDAAREIITAAVDEYIDTDLILEARTDAQKFAEGWREKLEIAFDAIKNEK